MRLWQEDGSLQLDESPHQKPTMLIPWSQTSSLQNCEEKASVIYKPPSLWYSFVIAAWMEINTACIYIYTCTYTRLCTCMCVSVHIHTSEHQGSSEILQPGCLRGNYKCGTRPVGDKENYLRYFFLPPCHPQNLHTQTWAPTTCTLSPPLLVLSANMSILWPQDPYPRRMSGRLKNTPPTTLPHKHRPPGAHRQARGAKPSVW